MPGRDIYWNNTSLLVNGNTATGSGGWDAGPNRLDVNQSGTVIRDPSSPFESAPGYWSNYFDGSGDYLSVVSNAAFQLGTGDYTIECWVYLLATPGSQDVIVKCGGNGFGAGDGGWSVYYDTDRKIGFNNSYVNIGSTTNTVPLNQWTHIAACRSGGTFKLFINGVSGFTQAQGSNFGSTGPVTISADGSGTYDSTHYVSNLRIIKGTGLYSADFTPPTTALTAVSGTSLLTCQDNRFKDNSTNNFTLTPTGNVSVEPGSPFRGGSVYFEGGFGGNWLSVSNSTNLQLGTGDFTIELWIKVNLGLGQGILSRGSPGWSLIVTNGSILRFEEDGGTVSSGVTVNGSKWNHVAIVRSGTSTGNIKMYLNGVLVGTSSFASTTNFNQAIPLLIGTDVSTGSPYSGYISNVRILKGTALYTSTFTPPGNELTPIANTVLLTCQSPTQLIDYSVTNSPVISTGSKAAVSNAGPGLLSKKYSVYGDGGQDWIDISSNAAFDQTGDFTIETWMNLVSPGALTCSIFAIPTAGYLGLYLNNSGQIVVSNTTVNSVTTSIIPTNSWNHVALVRSGSSANNCQLYINGTSVSTFTYTTNTTGTAAGTAFRNSAGFSWRGYMSNLRVTNNAVYTTNFTVPTGPLEVTANTVLLTFQDSTFIDNSIYKNTISPGYATNMTVSNKNPFDFNRYTQTYDSILLDDSSFGLYTSPSTIIPPGTGDFTLECYHYHETASGTNAGSYNWGAIAELYDSTGSTSEVLQIRWNNTVYDVANTVIAYPPSASIITGSGVAYKQWKHFALVRNNGTLTFYIDGVSQGSLTYTKNLVQNTIYINGPRIRLGSYLYGLIGRVSNLRYTKSARYTGNFTPPLVDFQPDSNTVALIAGTSEITPRNSVVSDASNNKTTITTTRISQSTISPYTTRNGQDYSPLVNGGSAYIGYNSSYSPYSAITTASISGLGFGTGDFTVELWVRMGQKGGWTGNMFTIGTCAVYLGYNNIPVVYEASTPVITGTQVLNVGVWNHVAISRSSGILKLFVNGVQDGSSFTSTYNHGSSSTLLIGNDVLTYAYVSDFRVVKGTAVYQKNFPVPTQPVGLYSLNNGTTSLYLPFTSSSIIDETGKNSIEPVGDVKSSTLIKKYNNTSMYFDGNGDYLKLSDNSVCQFGTGDYTVECWFNLNTTNISYPRLIALGNLNTSGNFQIELNPTAIRIHNNTTYPSLSYSWASGVWYHLAVVRISGTLKVFINGTILYTDATNYTSTVNSTGALTIGSSDGGNWFNGYIDDLRITKGVARYTADFTVPSTNLPTAEVYTQPVVTNYQDNGTDLGSKYVTKSYLTDWYSDLIPALQNGQLYVTGGAYTQDNITGTGLSNPTPFAFGGSWKYIASAKGTAGFGNSSYGIKSDGSLWVWGTNGNGQLGTGNYSYYISPVTTAGGGTNWKQVCSYYQQAAGIKTDGTLWTWGYNLRGQLGDNTTVERNSPVTTAGGGTNWKQVSLRGNQMAAVKTDGTLWACGYNVYGQLGTGDTTTYSSPVTTAGGGTNWKQVSVGSGWMAAVKTDGTLWTWGYNGSGQLGDGTSVSKRSPVTTAGGGTDWKQVSAGSSHCLAIKQDGTLWAWGDNGNRLLADGTLVVSRNSPVTTVAGGTNWKTVVAGDNDSRALKTDGTLWVWGINTAGKLGDGSNSSRSSPVQTSLGGSNWKFIGDTGDAVGYAILDSSV